MATRPTSSTHTDGESLTEYARRISTGAADVAERLRTRSLDELAADAQRMARANPGLFVIGSAFAGFALARLMKSSSHRERGERSDGGGAGRAMDSIYSSKES